MAELITDCPRCGAAHTTFEVLAHWQIDYQTHVNECFARCRACNRGTIFEIGPRETNYNHIFEDLLTNDPNITHFTRVIRFIGVKDVVTTNPPDHIPPRIRKVFIEGATCLKVDCFNAAGAMFRLCVDMASKSRLPETGEPNAATRRSLGLRLNWLFDNDKLPEALRDLSSAVKDDGNDGAHDGTLTKADTEDLLDFTTALLERLYTEPERLRLAKERRDARRAQNKS